MITDGLPTDDWQEAAKRIREFEEQKKIVFFGILTDGEEVGVLSQISVRPVKRVDSTKFNDLFLWLSASQKSMSQSSPGNEAQVRLPAPSWETV